MSFRLKTFKIENRNFKTSEIVLIDEKKDQSSNYFSLIVGNNGTGKSRLLGSIARTLSGKYKYRNSDLFDFTNIEISKQPSKVITLSNSLSDKFPTDSSYPSYRSSHIDRKEQRYNYLGTKNTLGSSSKALMRRATDILLENYSNNKISRCYRHVFDYLNYEPVIKLQYRIYQRDFIDGKDLIKPRNLLDYINKQASYSSFKKSIFESFEDRYRNKLKEICDFLNELKIKEKSDYELTVNFSSDNIYRISKDSSLYEDDLKIYEILNILRKINMVKGFDISVFKKGGEEVNFSDASSGESSILTTLIALIPLLEDDCCVLIDEPEISLHPNWQYRYIELLTKIFHDFQGCHIIVASHSHFLISDLPPWNSSVITLKQENGIIQSNLLPESTFG